MTLHNNYTTKTLLISALLGAASWISVGAANPVAVLDATANNETPVSDISDHRTCTAEIPDETDDIDIPIPSFIRTNSNHIIYNGADWSGLRKAFLESTTSPVSIVHIGDSHIQADISTGTTRELLQYDFGNAGRGLVSPLKMIGPNDLDLMLRLARAGSVDGKFRRMIAVYVDITAPLYWWKEFDTYKVGTVANSTSTMHKLHAKPLEVSDFSADRLSPASLAEFERYVGYLETVRQRYAAGKDKADWYDLIQLLPSSYNQMRTVTMNYEVLANIYYARRNHKLDEWHTFCGEILAWLGIS